MRGEAAIPTIGHATISRAEPGADWQASVVYDEPAVLAALTDALNGFDLP